MEYVVMKDGVSQEEFNEWAKKYKESLLSGLEPSCNSHDEGEDCSTLGVDTTTAEYCFGDLHVVNDCEIDETCQCGKVYT